MSDNTDGTPNLGEVKSSDKRFRLGVWASALWVIAMGLLAWVRSGDLADLSLNEWGDFFAGAFAPLAFLWLVLGYMQQGEELRMSTRALELQARELKESADQQRQLVEVTRQQVESEREALENERKERELLHRPIVNLLPMPYRWLGSTHSEYPFQILNTGHTAISIEVTAIDERGRYNLPVAEKVLERGKSVQIAYKRESPLRGKSLKFELSYQNVLGQTYGKTVHAFSDPNDDNSNLEFMEI